MFLIGRQKKHLFFHHSTKIVQLLNCVINGYSNLYWFLSRPASLLSSWYFYLFLLLDWCLCFLNSIPLLFCIAFHFSVVDLQVFFLKECRGMSQLVPVSWNKYTAAAAKSLQSCLTLCDPIDNSPPGSPVPGLLQARTLEWVAISFSNAWKWKVKVKSLSCVWLFTAPWTAAYQAPLSMGFSRREYWSGLPLRVPFNSQMILPWTVYYIVTQCLNDTFYFLCGSV